MSPDRLPQPIMIMSAFRIGSEAEAGVPLKMLSTRIADEDVTPGMIQSGLMVIREFFLLVNQTRKKKTQE